MATSSITTQPLHSSSFYDHQSETQDDPEKLFEIVVEGKNKKYICMIPDCQKVFRFHSEMQRHIASHSALKPHRCTFEGCTKEFKRPSALENHIRSQHTGEAPLLCPHTGCGLRFSTEAKYRYHVVSHMEEKPFQCQYPHCTKSFMTASQLKQHEKSPTVHKKIDLMYRLKEKDQGETPTTLASCDDFVKIDETGFKPEPVKKVKYDIQNKRLSQLLGSLQSGKLDDGVEPKLEESTNISGPLLDQVLIQNELLRQKLENSESMLDLMRKQIGDINTKRVGSSQAALSNSLSLNVNSSWLQTADSFLIHDPLSENMKSFLRDEDLAMKTDYFNTSFHNEKMDFLIPSFHFDF